MPQLTLALSPDESLTSLSELLEQDIYIESLETRIAVLKEEAKELKESLKDAIGRRSLLSYQARQGAVKQDDGGAGEGKDTTATPSEPTDDSEEEDGSDGNDSDGQTIPVVSGRGRHGRRTG